MDRATLSQRIESILNEITRLSNTLYAMDNTNIQRHSDNYEMLSTEAALRGEVIACRLRHLIYETTTIRKAEYLTSAGVMQGISVIEKDGILEITLPCLLPKKSKKHSCEYLTDPIYYTLSKYAQTHTLPKFRHCVVCFSHIYSRELSPNRVRDYDNLELKQLLDVIATFVMEDDTGLLCDAYNTTEIGDSDCTRVSVMDRVVHGIVGDTLFANTHHIHVRLEDHTRYIFTAGGCGLVNDDLIHVVLFHGQTMALGPLEQVLADALLVMGGAGYLCQLQKLGQYNI